VLHTAKAADSNVAIQNGVPVNIRANEMSHTIHTSYFTSSPWRWNWQRVPKRRQTTIGRRGNTQKNTYMIQNTEKVWNQEQAHFFFLQINTHWLQHTLYVSVDCTNQTSQVSKGTTFNSAVTLFYFLKPFLSHCSIHFLRMGKYAGVRSCEWSTNKVTGPPLCCNSPGRTP
jgi:hypothetical protein